tara:strand:- start:14325 stop:15704 length:1380 start_codon:yes stop_codon:yes gene_type:complete
MLPSLANLRILNSVSADGGGESSWGSNVTEININESDDLDTEDEREDEEPPTQCDSEPEDGAGDGDNDAQKLLKILRTLPVPEVPEDAIHDADALSKLKWDIKWVECLTDKQFDMLLSMRLYTGALYAFMAPALDTNHVRKVQSNRAKTHEMLNNKILREEDHEADMLFYVATIHWLRRQRNDKPSGHYTPLLVERDNFEGKETYYLDIIDEMSYRRTIASGLTFYEDPSAQFYQFEGYRSRLMDRILGNGKEFDALKMSKFASENKDLTDKDLAAQTLQHFWAAIQHSANALKSFILDSKVVADINLPLYRGTREPTDRDRLENSFVSMSATELTARYFTTSPFLNLVRTEDDKELEERKEVKCCMMRATLEQGVPYLDVDDCLLNSGGWGFFSGGENEIILPPGHVRWVPSSYLGWNKQPVEFPKEPTRTSGEYVYRYDYVYYVIKPMNPPLKRPEN